MRATSLALGLLAVALTQGVCQDEVSVLWREASEAVKAKDYKSALSTFQRLVDEYPASAEANNARLRIGFCLVALSRYKDAEQAFLAAAEANRGTEDEATALLRLGLVRDKLAATAGTVEDRAYYEAGALEAWRRVLENEDTPASIMQMALKHYASVRYRLATRGDEAWVDVEEDLQNLRGRAPEGSEARIICSLLLVQSALSSGNLQAVSERAAEVIASGHAAAAAEALYCKGLALAMQGVYVEAAQSFERILSDFTDTATFPNEAPPRRYAAVWAGLMYAALGRTEDARKAYQRVLIEYPGSYEAQTAAAELKELPHEVVGLEPASVPELRAARGSSYGQTIRMRREDYL